MYQESVDKSGNSSRSDILLFILLIAAFFAVGSIALYLEKVFSSAAPRYVFIGLILVLIYVIYRLRIIGYRYTVFYKAPEPVYDPRFDDMMIHEDYPYPVGTVVFERIVSAKGTVLLTLSASEIVALAAPAEDISAYGAVRDRFDFSRTAPKKSHSLIFRRDGELSRLYFSPSAELLGYIESLMKEAREVEE